MAINPGTITMNIHVSFNDGDPVRAGYLELDHVPTQAQLRAAFHALADGLTKKEADDEPASPE